MTKKELIYADVLQKFEWGVSEYDSEIYKNRPKNVLLNKIKESEEDLKWLLDKFYEYAREND